MLKKRIHKIHKLRKLLVLLCSFNSSLYAVVDCGAIFNVQAKKIVCSSQKKLMVFQEAPVDRVLIEEFLVKERK